MNVRVRVVCICLNLIYGLVDHTPFRSLSVSATTTMSDSLERSLSSFSQSSQPEEDWDRSLLPPEPSDPVLPDPQSHHTPRNSIVFPAEDTPGKTSSYSSSHTRSPTIDGSGKAQPKRTLSELLRLHSEKGSNGKFSAEEALRIADVLGQWVCTCLFV